MGNKIQTVNTFLQMHTCITHETIYPKIGDANSTVCFVQLFTHITYNISGQYTYPNYYVTLSQLVFSLISFSLLQVSVCTF